MTKKTQVLCALLLLFITVSCQNESMVALSGDASTRTVQYVASNNAEFTNMGVPYTSPSELAEIAESDVERVVDFRVARYLATVELLAGASDMFTRDPCQEWMLSPYPKVVYNFDNTPKYYEFGLITPNGIIGTITTYAQKEIDGVIAYLFTDPLPFGYADMDYYAGVSYPARYYGYGEPQLYYKEDETELQKIDFELPPSGTDEYFRQIMFESMKADDIAGIDQDLEESGSVSYVDDYIQICNEYWNSISNFFNTHAEALLLWDAPQENLHYQSPCNHTSSGGKENPETEEDYLDELLAALDYAVGYYNTYILPEYNDPRLQVTFWSKYCGPAACAWVYRGKYDNFNGEYLPIFGDAIRDYFWYSANDLYAYYDLSVDVSGLKKEEARDKFIERSQEADYGVAACFYKESVPVYWSEWKFPLYHGGLNRGFDTATNGKYKVFLTTDPYEWITLTNEPVIIGINCNHYIVAFGTGVTKKTNGRVKDKYFAIVDNGNTTGEYGYHPYMRKHNGWNLHYGLQLK